MCFRDLLRGVGIALFLTLASMPGVAKEPSAPEMKAAELVTKALHAELHGDAEQRELLLQQATKIAPKYAPARWQLGQVSHQGKWMPVAEVARETQASETYTQYRELRKRNSGSALGELLLARWCRQHKLRDEEQMHWAAVLHFDPENLDAARALGLQKYHSRWLKPEQIEQFKLAERQFESDRDYWKPRLTRWADAIEKRSGEERDGALASLRAIDDLAAIPWLEVLVSKRSEELGREVMDVVARQKEQAATASLVRHALLSQFDGVRRSAIEKLKDRPIETFVGPLVEGLTAPPEVDVDRAAQAAPVRSPSLLKLSVSARVETMTDVHEVDSTFRGISFSGQFGADTFLGLAERWALVGQLNALEVINGRVCELLEAVTDQKFGRDEKKWWQWWAEYNQRFVGEGQKPVRKSGQDAISYNHLEFVPGPPRILQPASQPQVLEGEYRPLRAQAAPPTRYMNYFNGQSLNVNPRARSFSPNPSCFVAGTPIHTKAGTVPVEDLRAGDSVLAQDVETGELAYKRVLQTTLRPATKILALMVDGEPVGCTLGHPLWVTGSGWTMAKDLKQGDRLHSLQGARTIESVRQVDEEPAYNLVVADFGSYFVGEQAVLVHDNSICQPTSAVVPGLIKTETSASPELD